MSAPDFSLLDVIRSRRPLIHCIDRKSVVEGKSVA